MLHRTNLNFSITYNFCPANGFNSDKSKIISFGKDT